MYFVSQFCGELCNDFSVSQQKSGALRDIRENAKALCGELNAEYWEVSAKSG